jgi:hypothetical protein
MNMPKREILPLLGIQPVYSLWSVTSFTKFFQHIRVSIKLLFTSLFKPNAPLANVVEDLGKFGKNLTKRDHVVIVGGPGNSLDRNYHYSIEKDIYFIAERTSSTNVGFVGLFRRHDKPWMDRKVRSMNLHLERALMGRGASHIGVTDTNCIVREDYTTHGLYLNSRGKMKLTLLIARSLGGDHVSGISSIPVITHATASPFLA